MKKILLVFFTFTILLIHFTSCKKDDPIIDNKGELVSATYQSVSETFTLTYSSGYKEKVNAVVNSTTTPPTASITLTNGTTIYVEDASVSGNAIINDNSDDGINLVSKFVYDGMEQYYLWAKEIKNKKPTVNDSDPEKYFYKILNSIDTQRGWSWITDDVDKLMAGFEGESTDAFGFQPLGLYYDETSDRVVGLVRYVYPNTPAEKAGLKRGDIITHANGILLNDKNWTILFGANSTTTFTVLDQNYQNAREVPITPAAFTTDPVLYHKVYQGDGFAGRKVGYLFYTEFTENYNESLYNVFSEFKSAGITDLVLDLRYNPGGYITAATYLASLIAPVQDVKNKGAFTIMSYNDYVNDVFDDNKWDRKDYLGEYKTKYSNPVNANVNNGDLKLYVITTRSSASASELLTFCLKPYMQVEQIGEKTSGKYTASWTLHAYNDYDGKVQAVYVESSLKISEKRTLGNWAMQPIVGKYTDKNNNSFINTNGLIPNHPIESTYVNELTPSVWKPIGEESDYLFAKALSLITGRPYPVAVTRSASSIQYRDAEFYSTKESILREGVIIDNPKLLPTIKKR